MGVVLFLGFMGMCIAGGCFFGGIALFLLISIKIRKARGKKNGLVRKFFMILCLILAILLFGIPVGWFHFISAVNEATYTYL